MTNLDHINAVIFDYSGTLCSERYFIPLGQSAMDAIADLVFGVNTAVWAQPWMRGDLTSGDIARYLANHLPYSEQEILAALRHGCSDMSFNPVVADFARSQRRLGRKTALVTANMDIFTDVVVPAHGLDSLFDIVLNTSDFGTLDKGVLWRQAFDTFGSAYDYPSALLIEDSSDAVGAFRAFGGAAYQYVDDPAFADWLHEVGYRTILRSVLP